MTDAALTLQSEADQKAIAALRASRPLMIS
jgi:hypothetical protein